jgi:acyl-CoA thioesterase I
MTMIQMRLTAAVISLLMAATSLGCKADRATEHSSEIDVNAAAQQARQRAASKTPTAEDAIAQNDSRPVIACFGDSLTAGYGIDSEDSYPAVLQRTLDSAGYRYRVVNLGISGDTTKDGLARVGRVLALAPAIVVVEFGGNDGLRGLPISSTRTNLDAIVAKLVPTHTQVVLAGITLPPQYGKAYVKEFDDTYHLAANKYHVPLLPFLLKDVYGVPGSIQQDGIHPTAQGARQVAKNVLSLIQPMLKK